MSGSKTYALLNTFWLGRQSLVKTTSVALCRLVLFHLRECKLGQETKATCEVSLDSSLTVNNDVMATHCFENKGRFKLVPHLVSFFYFYLKKKNKN